MMNDRRLACATVFSLGICLQIPATARAGQIDPNARQSLRLSAVRAAGPITFDGTLNEPAWDQAPVATDFIQNEPHQGEPASEETDVRVLYDDDNLYVGVFAHDREPGAILTNELTKDFNRQSGDEFQIVLDTFHDERNGYMFATNPFGAKWDAQMINEGREVNENWDALWNVEARIMEGGWYAEIAIPFRTLRFSSDDLQTWGINFQRRIRRRNEDSYWAPLPRIYELQRVSMAGTLEGLQGVRVGSDLRVKPYVLGSSGKSTLASVGSDFNAGLDVKYGVTSGLTWDFTINTDFSQVEVDEQQVNLTRFSLFFPEKRDFFLENSGIFQFAQDARNSGGGGFGGGFGVGGNIGGGRQNTSQDVILFFSRRIGLSDAGESIPILGGTRLTGRVGEYSVGALNIQQRSTETSLATNFTALRLRRNVLANSDVGLLVLNQETDGPGYNRVVGTDGNFRFFQNLNFNIATARTFSPAAVVTGVGSESMGKTSISYRDDLWDLRSTYLRIGERFNDEMGYLPRTGIVKFQGGGGPRFRPKRFSTWMREFYPHLELTDVSRMHGDLQSRYVDAHVYINLQDSAGGEIGLNPTTENLIAPFQINKRRNISIPAGRYDFNEWFAFWRTNGASPLSFNGRWAVGNFYDGYKQSYQFGGAVRVRGRFNAGLNWSRNQVQLKEGRYATDLISTRIQYGFSTMAFINALVQYNTDAGEWSSNVRFNIIHHPLSDFFLVFNERRDQGTGGLLDRAVIAKMTYLVAF